MEAVFIGSMSALAIMFILLKLDIYKILYFDIAVDIISTITLVIIYQGTYAGMSAGVIAGAIISIILFVLKKTIGYKKPTLNFRRKVTLTNFITWSKH